MAVDLGTANTLVYVRGRGIVLSEPSVVAIDVRSGEVHAVGLEAKRMLGRTPGTIQAIRPLKDGVIADFDVTEQMLRHFIQKVHQNRWAHPRVVVCVPSGVTGVEKRAVEEACLSAGARQAYLIEEPMAAAIGVGLPVQDPAGNMIIDIGGGTTEVAIISLSGIVFSRSVRVAGDELDEAIVQYMKRAYNLMVGERTAEEIKIKIGSAYPSEKETSVEVKGRDLVAGLPKTLMITSQEVREALLEPISTIVDSVRITLERCPPELSADLVDRGLVLAGGGALLRGFDKLLSEETGLPVHVAEDPLSAVAEGTGKCLNELKFLRQVASADRQWR
jgi:rod shape-determining protein MreB and related proteins